MWLVFKENSLFWPPPFGDKINTNFFSMKKNFFEIIIRVLIISAQTCLNKKPKLQNLTFLQELYFLGRFFLCFRFFGLGEGKSKVYFSYKFTIQNGVFFGPSSVTFWRIQRFCPSKCTSSYLHAVMDCFLTIGYFLSHFFPLEDKTVKRTKWNPNKSRYLNCLEKIGKQEKWER